MKIDRLITILDASGQALFSLASRVRVGEAVRGVTDNEALDCTIRDRLLDGKEFRHTYTLAGLKIHVKLVPANLPHLPRGIAGPSEEAAHV